MLIDDMGCSDLGCCGSKYSEALHIDQLAKGGMFFADYASYFACQDKVAVYQDTENWTRMSILNVARMGYFSSDRAIREYCGDIWKVMPVKV